MRNLLMSILFFGIVFYLGSILYKEAVTGDRVSDSVAIVEGVIDFYYPDKIEIESADGRGMLVTLLGRNATHIEFARDDGQEFVYAIGALAADSQKVVSNYPNLGIQNAADYLSKGDMDLGDLYVQELERKIREIDKKVGSLTADHNASTSKVKRRTILRNVQELTAEKTDMQQKISERI